MYVYVTVCVCVSNTYNVYVSNTFMKLVLLESRWEGELLVLFPCTDEYVCAQVIHCAIRRNEFNMLSLSYRITHLYLILLLIGGIVCIAICVALVLHRRSPRCLRKSRPLGFGPLGPESGRARATAQPLPPPCPPRPLRACRRHGNHAGIVVVTPPPSVCGIGQTQTSSAMSCSVFDAAKCVGEALWMLQELMGSWWAPLSLLTIRRHPLDHAKLCLTDSRAPNLVTIICSGCSTCFASVGSAWLVGVY